MANSSFFKSDGQTTTLQTNLEDKAADAEKLAINPEDDQFTLSDGTTTGYSALHHKEKALDAQTAAESAKTASETAKTASEAAKVAAEGFRDTAETHKDAAASSATSASTSAATATTKASEASTSASNASTSATNSETSKVASVAAQTASEAARDTAQGYRDTAETHKNAAASSATSASTSASTATTKASEASTSASNAATSATNSETSKVASVAAQTASESARDLAQGYRDTAETHKNAAATSATSASTSASTASTKASEASTSAAAAAASQTAAAASAASAANTYDQFDDRYLGVAASDPSTDNDGNALVEGALYFSSTDNAMQVYDGSAWIAASSAGNVSITETHFTATAGQTTFNVSYTVDNLVVIMNGVVLQNGASKDYTATNGTSFTLASGAAAGDELHVIVFKSFTTADMVSKTNGGTYSGSVDFTGGLEINGTAVTATAAELNTLDGITATTSELNLLDGVTATTAELNYVDGVTSNIQTQIDNISTDVVSDTSPSLGGDLDGNGFTIDLSSNTGAIRLNNGTTAQRGSGSTGEMRFNTTIGLAEYYDGNSWKAIDSPPSITSISPSVVTTASASITLTGTNFQSGMTAEIIGNDGTIYTVPTVSVTNASTAVITTPSTVLTVANEPYSIKVTNTSGLSNTLSDALDAGSNPSFTTASGNLGTVYEGFAASGLTTVAASDADGQSVSMSLASGNYLPGGLTFNSNGTITGTTNAGPSGYSSAGQTWTFNVNASDGTNTSSRTFNILRKWYDGSSSALATTPYYLRNEAGITTDGNYHIKTGSMNASIYTYINFGLVDGKDWVLMMHLNQTGGGSGSVVGTDFLNQAGGVIPFKGFNLEKDGADYYSYFSSYQNYAGRTSQATSSGGNRSGYRLFLGQSGGHGWYNTGQNPCSWPSSNGAVGAGYDGSCGHYPSSLRMGFGNSGAFYNLSTGQWKSWIWMDNKLPV